MTAARVLRPGCALCLCMIMLIPAGCTTGGRSPVNPGQRSNTGWPFWPTQMRIHPLSQFVKDRQTGRLLLEARVEFHDPDGHTCKAYGEIVIAMYDANAPQDDEKELATWPEDLTDLGQNKVFFDDVTGTYLFRLEIGTMAVPQESELRAIFRSADGTVLQDSYVVTK